MIGFIWNSLDTIFNVIGVIGMLCILLAYAMQQAGRWQHQQPPYLYCNIIGALGLMASLCWSWNLPSFLLECAWLIISFYGLFRYYRKAASP